MSLANVYSCFSSISNAFYLYTVMARACSSTPYCAHAHTSKGCGYGLRLSASCRTAVLKKHIFSNIYRIFVKLIYPLNYPLPQHYHLWSRFTNYWLVCKASSASSQEYFTAFTTAVKLNELCAEQIDIQWWVCWGWEYLWWTIIVCRKFSIKWYTNSEFYVHKSNQRWRLYFKVSFSAPNHGNK